MYENYRHTPYCNSLPNIESTKVACGGEKVLEEMVFFENAGVLLQLELLKG